MRKASTPVLAFAPLSGLRAVLTAAFTIALTLGAIVASQAMEGLQPLPPQAAETPWPTEAWPTGAPSTALSTALDQTMANQPSNGVRAALVIQGGRLLGERYAPGFDETSLFQSWSMAKSVIHALVGILVRDGQIDIYKPAKVARWNRKVRDTRTFISVENLLRMESGLFFAEVYDDPDQSSVLQMLFGRGRADMAEYAAGNVQEAPPATLWHYSSGSTNIISGVIRDIIGAKNPEDYRNFMEQGLFRRIGITSAVPEFDAANTFIGSSYLHMTARDWARFGLLYLRGGVWDGKEILPPDWVDHARWPTLSSAGRYGAHFWLNAIDPETGKAAITDRIPTDAFLARGFGAQVVLIIPSLDAVIVYLGISYDDPAPVVDAIATIVESLER